MGFQPMSSTGILPVDAFDLHGRDAHVTHGKMPVLLCPTGTLQTCADEKELLPHNKTPGRTCYYVRMIILETA